MKKLLFFYILFFLSLNIFAATDFYQFNSAEKENQFHVLTTQLRCLVCQNQNLAESNASLASDLRQQIYQQIQQGQPNKYIIDYLVSRYGNFILYNPPVTSTTLGLWFGPFIFLFIGICYLIYYIKKRQRE